jgi:hypothetical protein
MPFKEGNSGRPRGAKGKKSAQWEALAESITGEQADHFSNHINKLWTSNKPEDKDKAADLFLKTVEYFKPKQARVINQISGDLSVNSIKFEDAEDSKN